MKTFTNKKGKEYLLIEVPDISMIEKGSLEIELPEGNYQIIGLAKEVSEIEAAEIVDCIEKPHWYKNYTLKRNWLLFLPITPLMSLSSLIQSLGLNNNVLILEKVR